MSMLDLFDEPETEVEETTETDACDDEELPFDAREEAPKSPVEDEKPEVEEVACRGYERAKKAFGGAYKRA